MGFVLRLNQFPKHLTHEKGFHRLFFTIKILWSLDKITNKTGSKKNACISSHSNFKMQLGEYFKTVFIFFLTWRRVSALWGFSLTLRLNQFHWHLTYLHVCLQNNQNVTTAEINSSQTRSTEKKKIYSSKGFNQSFIQYLCLVKGSKSTKIFLWRIRQNQRAVQSKSHGEIKMQYEGNIFRALEWTKSSPARSVPYGKVEKRKQIKDEQFHSHADQSFLK